KNVCAFPTTPARVFVRVHSQSPFPREFAPPSGVPPQRSFHPAQPQPNSALADVLSRPPTSRPQLQMFPFVPAALAYQSPPDPAFPVQHLREIIQSAPARTRFAPPQTAIRPQTSSA